nr:unknown [Zea mays]
MACVAWTEKEHGDAKIPPAVSLQCVLVPVRPSAVRRRGVVEGDGPAVGFLEWPPVAPGAVVDGVPQQPDLAPRHPPCLVRHYPRHALRAGRCREGARVLVVGRAPAHRPPRVHLLVDELLVVLPPRDPPDVPLQPVNGPVRTPPRDPVELRDHGVPVGVALVHHLQLQGVPAPVDGVLARRVPVHLPEPVRHAVDHHAAGVAVEP